MINSEKTIARLSTRAFGIFVFIAFGTALSVLAQAPRGTPKPKPLPPPGPLLSSPPNFSEWVTTFSYPQDEASTATTATASPTPALPPLLPSLPRTVLTTKTGNIIHEQTIDVSGKKFDKWQDGGTIYVMPPGKTTWFKVTFPPGNLSIYDPNLPLPPNGFRDLDWISKDSYVGTLKTATGATMVFLPTTAGNVDLSDPKSAQSKLASQPVIAYIDFQTRLPVSVKAVGVLRTYTFNPPPGSTQKLPDALTKEIQEGQARRAKLSAVPSQ